MSTVKSKKLQVGTDASASNNFTIYQPSTPDGTLRIGQGTADSPTEVGQFNSNGYKPEQPVAFSAYSTTNLSISNNTVTKVTFPLERFDTNSNYDTSTSKFTPTVAGYYQITTNIHATGLGSSPAQVWTAIYKNGNLYQYGGIHHSQQVNVSPISTALIYMNGSTDNLEVYCRQSSGATATVLNSSSLCYFQGILIAQA